MVPIHSLFDKSPSVALFISSPGFVSGPQFFGSLGKNTVNQVHITAFSCVVVFAVVRVLAHIFDLDKGTAAGLLATATSESASVGTASEALKHLGLDQAAVKQLEANIGVTYAVTCLFGFVTFAFYTSTIAPRLMGVNLNHVSELKV